MRTEIVTITPEMAKRWLDSKGRNRRLIRSSILSWSRIMKAGHWRLTHQGIAFDENGELVDGQHRLAAIVESGVSVTMMVTWGISREVMQSAVDRNKKRTAAHSFTIDGEINANAKAAICRALYIIETPSVGYSDEVPYEALREMLEKYRGEIERSCAAITGTHIRIPSSIAGLPIVMERAGLGTSWIDGVKSGIGLSAGDPRLLLRNWLVGGKKVAGTGASATVEFFGRGSSSADAWMGGESISKLHASRQRYERWCKRVGMPINSSISSALG